MIIQAMTQDQIDDARRLFIEYQEWFGLPLCFQNFEEELATLPGAYAPPDGRLYLAYFHEELAGCGALRKLEVGICEMKRLFVRNAFRGNKIGVALIDRILADARAIGYGKIRLDTVPERMGRAVSLYESYGFRQIEPYYHNPYGETLFLEKLI
jgi:ribosomal protein S18 acetylase RimI-like enzyme